METVFHDFSVPLFAFRRNTHWLGAPNLHFHIHYELDVIRSGEITIIANGTRLYSRGPCMILYKPFCYHVNMDHNTDDYDLNVFHFNGEVAKDIANFVNVDELYRPNVTYLPLEGELCDEVMSLLGAFGESPEREVERRLILAALLDFVKRNYALTTTDRAVSSDEKLVYIREISTYISEHYPEKLTAEGIAKQFLVSRQKLDADFKSIMNMTLKQYILDIRVANSIRLMSLGRKVADVTYDCGFSSESHFIHIFKDHMGISPYQYSKMLSSAKD